MVPFFANRCIRLLRLTSRAIISTITRSFIIGLDGAAHFIANGVHFEPLVSHIYETDVQEKIRQIAFCMKSQMTAK